jgi:mono/diheme cytochrome c family protein
MMLAAAATVAAQPRSNAVQLGEISFKTNGCFNCHTIGKVGTPLGPDLSHIGTKYPGEYMARWLRDPALQRPNAHMPALDLSEAQVRALAAYPSSLE